MNSCAHWGHHVDNHILETVEADRRCRSAYLSRWLADASPPYALVFLRGGYDQFVDLNCGHPFCFARRARADRAHSGSSDNFFSTTHDRS